MFQNKYMFNLNDAYEALNGRTEFAIRKIDGRVTFDYIVIFPGSFDATEEEIRNRAYFLWENSKENNDTLYFWLKAEKDVKRFAVIRRNFRGVTFDEITGEIISLPFHKFFNVNQIAETQFDLIKHCDAIIYEKLDGSMIHFFKHKEKLYASTCRSSDNLYALTALDLAKKLNLEQSILNSINDGWTPIFEYVAPNNQIVVKYNQARLVYLMSRERKTGNYFFDESFEDKAKKFKFRFEEVFNNLDVSEFEGYVCHLPHAVVKVKTPWYNERHRAVDALMRPAYKLYKIVFDGLMDDLIAIATESYKPVLEKIYVEAQTDLLNEKIRIENKFLTIKKEFDSLVLPEEDNKFLIDLQNEVGALVAAGQHISAIKLVRELTGLGLLDAKNYVIKGLWPDGFEAKIKNTRTLISKKGHFVNLVRRRSPDDFSFIMSLYQGNDPDVAVKNKLMEGYKLKYSQKLYAALEENHEDG